MKSLLQRLFNLLGYEVQRRGTPYATLASDPDHPPLLYALARSFRSLHGLRFLQIGANDGRRNDPICRLIDRFEWSGVFVEPDPAMMEGVAAHRSGPRFTRLPFAISRRTERTTFYSLGGAGLPDFANGLGTLSRDRIEQAARDLADYGPTILEKHVDCLSVRDLLHRVGEGFDVCVIDVEGLDFEILQLLSESRALARVMHYEHKCLSDQDRQSSFELLMAEGFELLVTGDDCTAYRDG